MAAGKSSKKKWFVSTLSSCLSVIAFWMRPRTLLCARCHCWVLGVVDGAPPSRMAALGWNGDRSKAAREGRLRLPLLGLALYTVRAIFNSSCSVTLSRRSPPAFGLMLSYPFSTHRTNVLSQIIGGVILLLAIGGIVAGVLVSRNNDSDSSSSGGSSASNFAKDPKLHKAFYGMAYTPELSMYPACGNSIEEVVKDMQMISQLTNVSFFSLLGIALC